jgi:hypothetical protein
MRSETPSGLDGIAQGEARFCGVITHDLPAQFSRIIGRAGSHRARKQLSTVDHRVD